MIHFNMEIIKLINMKNKSFNLGLIGTGKILKKHLSVLNNSTKFRISAIHSRSYSNGIKFCKDNNIETKKYFKNIIEFISYEEIDAFFICVSNESIDKILNVILKTKKPFFIEKPPVVNLNKYNIVRTYIKKNKILNMVGLNRRYYSNLLKIRELFLNSGGIQSVQIEGNERIWQKKDIKPFRKKNWIVLNSIHTLDLIFFLCGDLDKVNYLRTGKNIFSLMLKSKSGSNVTYTSNWNSPGGWSIKLHNDLYYANIEPLESSLVKNRNSEIKKIHLSRKDIEFKPGFYLQIENFYKLLVKKKHSFPSIGIEDCNQLYGLIKKIHE